MYSTEAIVLKKTPIGEANALLALYTEQYGKLVVLAIGVYKEQAKLKGHIEPLNYSNIRFVFGRAGERLTNASLIEYWPNIRRRIGMLRAAHYILALYDRHCMRGEADPELWGILLRYLAVLESDGGALASYKEFLKSFEVQFLEGLGFGGETDIRTLQAEVSNPF